MSGSSFSGVRAALIGSLFLAILSTIGDWIWAQWIPAGKMIHGVVHGAVIFAALGLVLALSSNVRGLMGRAVGAELVLGIAISASFYPLYRWVGLASLFITWMALWLGTALVARWLRAGAHSVVHALIRGTVAAVLSGLAFWAVSGIWTRPDPDGPNLAWHLLCWFFAFLPGFAALLVSRRTEATV